MISIIFPSDTFDISCPNLMWEKEFSIASNLGQVFLFDFQALLEGNVKRSLRKLPQTENELIVYHGWMMIPEIYEKFYQGLKEKGYKLINHPQAYLYCHHIFNWYTLIHQYTPNTKFVFSDSISEILNVVKQFDNSPLIIKDFVSSQKHSWKEACFIPNVDIVDSTKVIATFIALQNEVDGIQGGIVLREFLSLKNIGYHPKSNMPLSQEFRSFVYNGKVIDTSEYWEYGNYNKDVPPKKLLNKIAKIIYNKTDSNLFTIDMAQKSDGDWVCIEVGDGQVSSLPEKTDKIKFYTTLFSNEHII